MGVAQAHSREGGWGMSLFLHAITLREGEEMNSIEPPNFREVVCCSNCKRYMSWECYECQRYHVRTSPWNICDDYEPEVRDDRNDNNL
jgi:hypothetical protein